MGDGAVGTDRRGRIRLLLAALCLSLPMAWPVAAGDMMDGLREHRFSLGGFERAYLSYVPATVQAQRGKPPLVLVIHGAGGSHYGMVKLTRGRFNRLADEHGFVVAYPKAVKRMWDFGEGEVSAGFRQRRDDLAYFREVIARIEAEFAIDAKRVFVTGNSRGGRAAYFIACKLPGRVRAIAPVTMPLPDYLEDDCRDGPPLPIALFNGTADPIVPFAGGAVTVRGESRGVVLSTAATLAMWRARNACADAEPSVERIDRVSDGTRVERVSWPACDDAPVLLFRIHNGGHTWPSGLQYLPERVIGKTTREIDGAAEIWRFFSQFE